MKNNLTRVEKCIICLAVFYTLAAEVAAQSPGGVATSPKLWTKANVGVTATGANVTQWANQSATAMTTQASIAASTDITLNSNDFNYNPSLSFSGASGKRLSGTFAAVTANPALIFAVVKKSVVTVPVLTSNNINGSPYSQGGATAGTPGIGYLTTGSFGIDNSGVGCGTTANIINIPGIVRADYNVTTTSLGANTAFNGLLSTVSTCPATSVNTSNSTFEIGGKTSGGISTRIFSGQIAEVIHYDINTLPGGAADINKIESYLALKYGLTLSNSGGATNGDYTSSAGTTIWTAATGSGYHNNVIGIGRDDNSALVQRQSHQTNDATQLYIGATIAASNLSNTGSFSTDAQFVMLGDDNAALAPNANNTELPSGLTGISRFDREWKITNTGFTGTFSLSILPSSGSYTAARIQVLVDDDGDFSNATVITPTITVVGGRIILTGISNAMIASGATKYITMVVAASPGGVVDNMQLWTKANAGVVLGSGINQVIQWTNQSSTTSMTAQGQASIAASVDIKWTDNDFNYNPSLTFSGVSGKRLSGNFASATVNPALMFAVVKKAVITSPALPLIIILAILIRRAEHFPVHKGLLISREQVRVSLESIMR
jgi:hypothetical protein